MCAPGAARRHPPTSEDTISSRATAPTNRESLSPRQARERALAALAAEQFDLLVVGGGITGCGIARDAALRGRRVALVEQDDFASGTSSRSSRLIHGGVRYLEHGHLHLVFEASAERRRLLRLAPHLVRPLAFTWPVYAGARVPRWKLSAGLTLYDALALFRNVAPHRRLSAREVLSLEPALLADGLRGGARYHDAATDDARLTLANALGAAQAGAVVLNHAAVRALRRDGGGDRVTGARVADVLGGGEIEVRARVVVNAAGPWSDAVQRLAGGESSAAVRGSKGVHIAVAHDRIGNNGALTLLSPRDGRVMFVLPAGPMAVVGTTDTYTASSPDEVRASEEDVRYLLDTANTFFPRARLERGDVVAAWAGIRPLVPTRDETPGGATREHVVNEACPGLVTITGGKLTTYRVMAADALAAVDRALGAKPPSARAVPTRDAPLPGGDVAIAEATREAERACGDAALASRLVHAHGSAWPLVWQEIAHSRDGAEPLAAGLPYTVGELRWSARHEMALTLADLLMRRMHLAFETRDHGTAAAHRAAAAVAEILAWDADAVAREVARYGDDVARVFAVEP